MFWDVPKTSRKEHEKPVFLNGDGLFCCLASDGVDRRASPGGAA